MAMQFINRGVAYETIADYEKTVVDYTEALKINPGYYLANQRRTDYKQKLYYFEII